MTERALHSSNTVLIFKQPFLVSPTYKFQVFKMGVEKGDVIKVEPENKWILQKVEWRSKMKRNEDEYYCANFENTKSRQRS